MHVPFGRRVCVLVRRYLLVDEIVERTVAGSEQTASDRSCSFPIWHWIDQSIASANPGIVYGRADCHPPSANEVRPTLQCLAAIVAAASQRLPLELHCLAKNLLEHVNFWGAGDGTRTRDSLLGKQVLYQLSYPRIVPSSIRRAESAVYRGGAGSRFDQRSPESVYSVGPCRGA
jgi:hypothetical protein